ncbi:MAG: MarR family transcriptional regulator [Eubacteriales bacterium]|nr:MarR family transcriptional regulator [Eubacteriales bacterium]
MNKELMHSVSESLLRLRLLTVSQLLKPMREIERERNEFPQGYLHVLSWLSARDAPVSMTDLAGASCISKPNLTTMVDRLCAEGLVARSSDVSDRRIVNVALTQKGMEYLNRHKEEVSAFIQSRLALLEDSELRKLKGALDDIADIIKIIEEKKGGDSRTHDCKGNPAVHGKD